MLWLVSRASGLALLGALSLVMVLGTVTRLGAARPGACPRSRGRNCTGRWRLFCVAFLVLHVGTAILDPFVSIGWPAAVLPFTSGYRPLAIGLGTLAVDLGGAVLLTSLIRRRLGYRAWRAVHWLALLAWPAAFAHSLLAGGGDLRTWWVALIEVGAAAAVVTAFAARLIQAGRRRPGNPRRPCYRAGVLARRRT